MTAPDPEPPLSPAEGSPVERAVDGSRAETDPAMPAVRGPEPGPESAREDDARAPLMPPEPPTNAPVVRISAVDTGRVSIFSEPPLSSGRGSLVFRSLLPDEARDTDTDRSTEVDLVPLVPTARDRALLLRLDGASAGEVLSIEGDLVLLGRHPPEGIAVNDPGVSRIHVALCRRDGRHVAEDRGSRNGTFVNGVRVNTGALGDGDTLQLGPRVAFRYTWADAHQEELLRQLFESSKRDALTGAFNRQHFEERLNAEVAYAQRHGADVGLVLFDLDHFKRVNDTHGHPAGDAVLRQVAGIVAQRLRTEDVFARVGGEEFVVILRSSNLKAVARVGERLRAAISTSPVHYEGNLIPISISVGCAALRPRDERGGQELVEMADRRLYAAKNGGRNRVVASD
ncbi:MAG TPA: diguanylate cyclase [Polyangiaceae bacterium]|nr:diguanylate cyclase [Polyangiaceae bacterium]